MKRVLYIVMFMILQINCNIYAQSLNTFANKANKGSEIEFEFEALDNKGNSIYSNSGVVYIFNDKYKMLIPDELMVIDNGVRRFIYKVQDDEIIIAPVNKEETDIMENPFAVLRYKKDKIGNYTIDVKAKKEDIPNQIILKANNGAKYIISIKKFKEFTNINDKFFEYNIKDYPNAIVTNLD